MDAATFQLEAMRYERLMYHISYSMLGNNDDCADAVQEALLRAWQKRRSLRDAERFRPWLMRILTNTCNDILRRRKKYHLVPLEDMAETAELPVLGPIQEAICALKPELRVVIVLHYIEGYTVREMAEMLGKPAGTIKSRMVKARRQLGVPLQDARKEADA